MDRQLFMRNTERGGWGPPRFSAGMGEHFEKEMTMNDETYYTWEQWNTLLESYKRKGMKS